MRYKGLSSEEVKKSRELNGNNKLAEQKKETFLEKLIGNFNDPIIKILFIALGINIIFTFLGKSEWYESIAILIAILLATIVSTYSEFSNEKGFQKLQEDANKIKIKVYRDGKVEEVLIDDIVVGDYVILQSGDKVPAECYLVDGNIKVDNSSLNGESEENKKHIVTDINSLDFSKEEPHDKYKTYRGSVVTSGEGVVVVTRVGLNTMMGRMSQEMNVEEVESPLKVKLKALAGGITKFGYIGSIFIALAFIIHKVVLASSVAIYFGDMLNVVNDLVQAVILAVIIIVMAAPEGLPLMVALVLAQNMKKMLNDNVLVRKLIGIETAGSLNILFSDKTGTITKGKLEVVSFVNGDIDTYSKYDDIPSDLRSLLNLAVSKNTGAMYSEGNVIGGNATDRALLKYIKQNEINEEVKILNTESFNSEKKYSATKVKADKEMLLYKGAVEKIVEHCKFYYDNKGNKHEFKSVNEINKKVDELSDRAIRVLAIATSEGELEEGILPNDLTLVGIVGIRDEVREEAIEAIRETKNAGIQVVMITGDRKETAIAIAKDSGLLTSDEDIVLTSGELQEMTDDEIKAVIPKLKVIARALPTDKSRMVRLSQELGLVVGMTGDGVNDAPALKKADVGFAMGSGTDVAKEAGDIIILDDNFKSITKAIKYGRTIYKNIQKFIKFQLTINVSAVLVSLISPFIGIEHPLSIVQILWVNLVMDTLAALALGQEPSLDKYMNEKPKKRDENIVTKDMWSAILTSGIYITIVSISFLKLDFFINIFRQDTNDIYHLTGYFTLFILTSVFNGLNVRSEGLNLFEHIKGNKSFIKIMGLIIGIQIIMTFVGGEILRCKPMTLNEWMVVVGLALTIIPIDLIRKSIIRKKS